MTLDIEVPDDENLPPRAEPRAPLGVFEELQAYNQGEMARLDACGAMKRFGEGQTRAGSKPKGRITLDNIDWVTSQNMQPARSEPQTLMDKITASKHGGGVTPTIFKR